jgi:hydroxyacylglutathione hydrolase
MQTQQRDTHNRVLFCLTRARKPVTISELLPEIMPVKTELDYAVSTGIGERRCYAEACIQTHLLWLIEEGKVQRVREGGKICFVANAE